MSFIALKTPRYPKDPKYDPEGFQRYYERVKGEFPHIPEDAFREWIYPFWERPHIQRLYGYLDFAHLSFSLEDWDIEKCLIVGWYSRFDRVGRIETNWSIKNFTEAYRYNNEVVDSWMGKGTWLKPIWVLNAQSFKTMNLNEDIKSPFMLIEGHSRLGTLRMLWKSGRTARNHKVWSVSESS